MTTKLRDLSVTLIENEDGWGVGRSSYGLSMTYANSESLVRRVYTDS
jgi:hypothetical protein